MHELPRELSNSLRSWRGSVYRNSQHEPVDVEKGREDYGEKEPRETQSSLILHPTASRQALSKATQDQYDGLHEQDQQPAKPSSSTKTMVAARKSPQTTTSTKKRIDKRQSRPTLPEEEDTPPLSLADFYTLIGLRQPSNNSSNNPQRNSKLALKDGLYAKIHHEHSHFNTKYRIFDVMTYALLVLQLFLSAVFIILGSAVRDRDTHVSIAVLGAVGTVVAGSLALMKGQGLPNRLRQSRDALSVVIFELDDLLDDVAAGREVFFRDVRKIREDLMRVMEEARRNHPDTWSVSAQNVAQPVKGAK